MHFLPITLTSFHVVPRTFSAHFCSLRPTSGFRHSCRSFGGLIRRLKTRPTKHRESQGKGKGFENTHTHEEEVRCRRQGVTRSEFESENTPRQHEQTLSNRLRIRAWWPSLSHSVAANESSLSSFENIHVGLMSLLFHRSGKRFGKRRKTFKMKKINFFSGCGRNQLSMHESYSLARAFTLFWCARLLFFCGEELPNSHTETLSATGFWSWFQWRRSGFYVPVGGELTQTSVLFDTGGCIPSPTTSGALSAAGTHETCCVRVTNVRNIDYVVVEH